MHKRILVSALLLGALVIAAVFGTLVYRTARAAAPTRVAYAHAGFGRGPGGGYTNEDLANALGISLEELNTAYQEAADAALDQAVQQGLITQDQADQIRARGAAFPFGHRWGGWLSESGIDFDALLADALGISVDDLREAYIQAYNARIDQAVANGRITQEQADLMKGQNALFSSQGFQSAMRAAFEAAVQQAVDSGLITQAQADQILNSRAGLGFPGFRGFGGFGRHGRWGGGLRSSPSPAVPQVTPSTGL